jgi:hypothetical protein
VIAERPVLVQAVSGLNAGSAVSPSYISAVIPSGASAWTVRSAAVLPDPRLVLPEMSRIRTSATPSTYPPGTGRPLPSGPGRTSGHTRGYFVR